MIEKINKQFDILASQQKRFDKIIASFHMQSALFSSLISGAKSVNMIVNNISSIFLQILNPNQLKILFKTTNNMINSLLGKLEEFNLKVSADKKEKDMNISKNKTHACSVCGQNIHQSNIRQAKIFLQQQSKQNFHLILQQLKKIAQQPLYTKQQNNEFQQKLHFQLSQRERVLNTNCNRIEQFTQLIDSSLSDLMRMKQIQQSQNQKNGSFQFMNASKIGQDVSNFLQKSFSEKIPGWIQRMFARMMTSYVEASNQRRVQKGVQASSIDNQQGKQIKQVIRQKKALQKQNKQLTDQFNELKLCYKKLQQICNQYAATIASMPKNMKIKIPQIINFNNISKQNRSRRNSKQSTRNQDKDPKQKQQTPQLSYDQQIYNYNLIGDEIHISKKKKKNNNTILPTLKKVKNTTNTDNRKQLNMAVTTKKELNSEHKKQQTSGRGTHRSRKYSIQSDEQAKGKISGSVGVAVSGVMKSRQSNPKNRIPEINRNNLNQKNLSNRKQAQNERNNSYQKNNRLSNIGSNANTSINKSSKKDKKSLISQQINTQQNADPRQTSQNVNPNKSMNMNTNINNQTKHLSKPNQKPSKKPLVKLNKKKLQDFDNKNTQNSQNSRSEQDSIRQLYEYVANITLNKKNENSVAIKGNPMDGNKMQQQNINPNERQKQGSSGYENDNDRAKYEKQAVLMKQISGILNKNKQKKRLSFQNCSGFSKQKKINKSLVNSSKRNQVYQSVNAIIYNNQSEQKLKKSEGFQNKQKFKKYDDGNNSDQSDYEQQEYQKYQQQTVEIEIKQNSNEVNEQKLTSKSNKNQTNQQIITKQKQQNQQKIFQILKTNNLIQKNIDYNLFTSLLNKLSPQKEQQQVNPTPQMQRNSTSICNFSMKYSEHQHRPSIVQEEGMQHAHDSIYGRLFLTKSLAYKYQQSMTKSYHKKQLQPLTPAQLNFCQHLYTTLTTTKRTNKALYHQFCSILRYPYQTLYNRFEVVNFIKDMSYETFQYFLRKLFRIHRRCGRGVGGGMGRENGREHGVVGETGACLHIQAVYQLLVGGDFGGSGIGSENNRIISNNSDSNYNNNDKIL